MCIYEVFVVAEYKWFFDMVKILCPAKAMATASGLILEGEGSSTIDSRAVACMIHPIVYL